jgi:hypothetical protein
VLVDPGHARLRRWRARILPESPRPPGRADLAPGGDERFDRILRDYPHLADGVSRVAGERYDVDIPAGTRLGRVAAR